MIDIEVDGKSKCFTCLYAPLRRKEAPCSNCVGQLYYRPNNVDCTSCEYGGRPLYKSPCSECQFNMNYSPKQKGEDETMENKPAHICFACNNWQTDECRDCSNYEKYEEMKVTKKIRLYKTTDMMCSDDYKDRFIAEYQQLKYRYEKLRLFNVKIRAAEYMNSKELMPEVNCPTALLLDQERAMKSYMDILEKRIVIEGIDLEQAMEEFYEAD